MNNDDPIVEEIQLRSNDQIAEQCDHGIKKSMIFYVNGRINHLEPLVRAVPKTEKSRFTQRTKHFDPPPRNQ